eukprot:s6279_g3.t1
MQGALMMLQDEMMTMERSALPRLPYMEGATLPKVRALSPLRVTLTHAEARTLLKGRPERSEYLTDSEQYPKLMQDLGVLVRKYSWPLPFVTLELWGLVEDVAAAALHYCSSAGGAEHRRLQLLLPEDKIAQVEHLPFGNPKVSTHAVVQTPVPCRSLVMESSAEDCRKAPWWPSCVPWREGRNTVTLYRLPDQARRGSEIEAERPRQRSSATSARLRASLRAAVTRGRNRESQKELRLSPPEFSDSGILGCAPSLCSQLAHLAFIESQGQQ